MIGSINSPFRYAGGKFYARKLILSHVPRHTAYVEPFAGGGSIFFAKPKVHTNQLNDIDRALVNVYLTIRDMPGELITFLERRPIEESRIPEIFVNTVKIGDPLPATKELHGFFKNLFVPKNELEAAGRWFYLNRTSYSGIMNIQNMYWGYGDKFSMQPKNWPKNIIRTSAKLKDVEISCHDFEEVIDNAPNGALLFVDPPYFNADQDKFYTYSFSKEDHIRLEKCLFRNKDRVYIFITYDNVQKIKELYSWAAEMHDQEWNYCIQRTDDQKNGVVRKGERYKGKELFILNYPSNNILKENYQLRLLEA